MRESVKNKLRVTGLYRPLRQVWRFVRGVPIRQYLRQRTIEKFYAKIVSPGDLCFDVGANIGIRTAALRMAGARVIAVEPQRVCINALLTRFRDDPDVIIEPVAVGESEGRLRLTTVPGVTTIASLSPDWPTKSQFTELFKTATSEEVPVTTLDTLIARYGMPKFCKIDVEGYEPEALAGLSHTIPLIAFEYNCKFLDHVAKCVERLRRLGPVQFNYAPTETMRYALPEWVDGEALLSRLETLDQNNGWGDVYARRNHAA